MASKQVAPALLLPLLLLALTAALAAGARLPAKLAATNSTDCTPWPFETRINGCTGCVYDCAAGTFSCEMCHCKCGPHYGPQYPWVVPPTTAQSAVSVASTDVSASANPAQDNGYGYGYDDDDEDEDEDRESRVPGYATGWCKSSSWCKCTNVVPAYVKGRNCSSIVHDVCDNALMCVVDYPSTDDQYPSADDQYPSSYGEDPDEEFFEEYDLYWSGKGAELEEQAEEEEAEDFFNEYDGGSSYRYQQPEEQEGYEGGEYGDETYSSAARRHKKVAFKVNRRRMGVRAQKRAPAVLRRAAP